MSSGEEKISQDVVFDVLSSTRRRQVLYLLKNEGEMELTELAEHVAAEENDTTVTDLTKQQRKRVYVSLYQTHVPKLEDARLVDYDQDTGEVQLSAQATDIDRYLDDDDRQFRWQYLYFAVAAIGLALVGLSSTAFWVFDGVSELAVALVVVVLVGLTAVAHLISWTDTGSDVFEKLRR